MNKINYHKIELETLKSLEGLDPKPTLCIHVCCGPCSIYPLSYLVKYFDITIVFNNSNIYPFEEYTRRLEELKHMLKVLYPEVKLLVIPYDEHYVDKIKIFKDCKEGQERCKLCYSLRMNEAYNYASSHNFDYFCTIMTISRQKNSQVLNQIGEQLSHKYPNTKYFFSDFKKENGNVKGSQMSAELHMYRQDYCGCVYSYEARQKQLKLREENNKVEENKKNDA